MPEPHFKITADGVQSYAEMFDIHLSSADLADLPTALAESFAGIAQLWQIDVHGVEPSTIFPADRL